MTDSTFTGNTAYLGGGIDVDSFSSGGLTAVRDTFTGNSAAGGGGIYNFDGLNATDDAFIRNTAPVGGASRTNGTRR